MIYWFLQQNLKQNLQQLS